MIDDNNIAKTYAESNGYASVRPSVERNGYIYFHIDYAIRLRYLVYSSYYREQSYREI